MIRKKTNRMVDKIKQIFFCLIIALFFIPAPVSGFFSSGEIDDVFKYKDLEINKDTVTGTIINKSDYEYTNVSFHIYATDCAGKNRFWKAWCGVNDISPGQKVPFKGYVSGSAHKKIEDSPCKIYFKKYTGRPDK